MTGLSVYLVTLSTLASAPVSSTESVVLEFSATWCTPCQKMAPLVHNLIQAGSPIRAIDIDTDRELARRFKVQNIPTFVLLINGREVNRTVGTMSRSGLQTWFHQIDATRAEIQHSRNRRHVSDEGTPTSRRRVVRANNDDTPKMADPQGLQSSVRLRVHDAKGVNYGSGTILESRPDRTLILTCGHIFRAMDKSAEVDVELFQQSRVHKFAGRLVDFDLNSDLGVVAIRTRTRLPASQLSYQPAAKQEAVYSVGCGGGESPTIVHSQVTALNRYLGPDNIECSGVPIQGRSGGGLFNRDHNLIGVCIAADPQDQRGLYAGLGAIQQLLQRLDLDHLCQPHKPADKETSQRIANETRSTTPSANGPPGKPKTETRGSSPGDPAHAASGIASDIRQAMAESAQAEIVCIIRPLRGSQESSRVIILNRASDKFVKYLAAELKSQPQPTMKSFRRPATDEPKWASDPWRPETVTHRTSSLTARQIPRRYQRSTNGR
ncbi:MAG: trypsin-like peptidase domain-containing protein [Planctomycetaceae bacterium]